MQIPPHHPVRARSGHRDRRLGLSLLCLCLVCVCAACDDDAGDPSDEPDADRADASVSSVDAGDSGSSSERLDAGGEPGGGPVDTDGGDDAFPPPPNDLDPGDGTLSTGGSLVYSGTSIRTVASSTGCGQQASTNRFEFVVSNFNEPFEVYTARITVPRDMLNASRVFEIGRHPEDNDFSGLDYASVRMFTPDGSVEWGSSGTIWVDVNEARVPTVRVQGIPLADEETDSLTGNIMSAALRCGEAVEP